MIYEDFLVLTDDHKCIPYDGSNEVALYKYIGQSKDVIIPEGIKILFSCIFSKSDIECIVFPESLTVISDSVLYGHQNLRKVVLGKNTVRIGDYAFYRCKSLESIIFPEGLEEIGCYAFAGCDSLKEVIFPKSLKKIDSSAFSYCTSLKSISFLSDDCELDSEIFVSCKNLTDVKLPNHIQHIPRYAFASCHSLKKIEIPTSVKEIGYRAFEYCENLETIALHEGLESIEFEAFLECTKLKRIVIPDTIESIGNSAFSGCRKLMDVKMPDTAIKFGSGIFKGTKLLKQTLANQDIFSFNGVILHIDCKGKETLTIPESVKDFNTLTFSHASEIKTLILNDIIITDGKSISQFYKLTKFIYNGIAFITKKSGNTLKSFLALVDENQYQLRVTKNFKYDVIMQKFLSDRYCTEKELIDFIKSNCTDILKWVLEANHDIIHFNKADAFYKLLPYENTLEKTLDNLIMAANQLGEYEIQLKLTEYVAEKYPRTVEETIKKKFRL